MGDDQKILIAVTDLNGQLTNIVWSFHGTVVMANLVADQLYFTRLFGSQNGTYFDSSASIWRLDPATNFSWSAAEFLSFRRSVERAQRLNTSTFLQLFCKCSMHASPCKA